jgi:hypothetical protein
MKSINIALAAAATLMGAAFINTEASAAPGWRGGGPGLAPMRPLPPGALRPPGFRPPGIMSPRPLGPVGGIRPGRPGGHFPGGPRPGGHGGHWGHPGWVYPAAGFVAASYFARPVYTAAYAECEWVRVRTAHGLRWRPYC